MYDYVFCEKCGRVTFGNPARIHYCDVCGTKKLPVPEKYIKKTELLTDEQMRQRLNEPNGLYEELVKTSPEFDQYLFDHRDEILAKETAKAYAVLAHTDSLKKEKSNSPKCPTCQSTNIRRISMIESGASIFAFGILSKKINKTFKCNSCGYTW